MREIRAKPGMPVWRMDDDGRRISLIITWAGRDAIGVEDEAGETHPPVGDQEAVALALNAGRGGFYPPTSGTRRWEALEYRGVHIAEAFIIRMSDDVLVGHSPHLMSLLNRQHVDTPLLAFLRPR
jgi:hypothetical protein